MSRNVMLIGGPANGEMARVEDDATAVHVAHMESDFEIVMGEFPTPMTTSIDYYLYRQSEQDKNVFNYAH